MSELRITSVAEPFAADRTLAELALVLLSRAEYAGCLPTPPPQQLDVAALRSVWSCLAERDLPVARWHPLLAAGTEAPAAEWRQALASMNEQLEVSPLPAGEWTPALDTLGEDMLARSLGISASSLRRYSTGARTTPQGVAVRLHFIAMLLADLAGSYNDYGIRRWFTRRRTALSGRSPIDVLGAQFDPDGDDAQRLRQLARSLVAVGAA